MKLASLLLLSVAFAATAVAGPVDYGKGSKDVSAPPPASSCFGPGFDVGIFGGGYLPRNTSLRDDGLGGGILAEYFFCDYFGIQATYGAFGPAPVHHLFGGDIVLRYPVKSCCVAPYVLMGGGGIADSANFGFFEVGGGIEARFTSLSHLAIFADGTYHFCSESEKDFTLVRIGVKFPF